MAVWSRQLDLQRGAAAHEQAPAVNFSWVSRNLLGAATLSSRLYDHQKGPHISIYQGNDLTRVGSDTYSLRCQDPYTGGAKSLGSLVLYVAF